MPDKVLAVVENGVCTITINRPEVRNALDTETWRMIRDFFVKYDADPAVRCFIITGAGDKAFAAGADLNVLKERSVMGTYDAESSPIVRTIEKVTKPIIAAINGFCMGGGLEISMACDIRIACANAKIGQTELNVGILPGAGGTQRLRNILGKSKALELILTGEAIPADEALRIGLINKVVPFENLMDEAKAMAKKIAAKSPIAVRLAKRVVTEGAGVPIDAGLAMESMAQCVMFSTDDHLEGLSAFLEKRSPEYTGK